MANLSDYIQLATRDGQPVKAGGYTVTPRAQTFTIRLPLAGFVYNRPTSVRVQHGDHVEDLPIVDVTRIGLIVFAVLPVLFFMIAQAKNRRKSKKGD